jgi:hypothetical protein
MPALTDRDYQKMDNPLWDNYASLLKDLQERKKVLESQESLLKQNLIELANNLPTSSKKLNLTKCHRKGSVDYAKIRELEGVDLDLYRRCSTEYWRFDLRD